MEELHGSSMSRSPIVIIGAGIGGLTLGRCLQRHKLPFTIYERADDLPRHNYGITLARQSYQPLLEVLQTNDLDFRRALAVVKADRTRVPADEEIAEMRIHTQPGVPLPDPSHELRANRCALETLLSKSITPRIKYSSKFKSIKPASAPGVQVEVTLDDDIVVLSDLVIDCSGVHSPVRNALLPYAQPVIHPFVAVNGKRYLSPHEWEEVYAPEFGESSVLQTNVQFEHEDNAKTRNILARLEVAVNETTLNGQGQLQQVSISYTYSRQAFPDNDPLYLPKRPKEAATDIPAQFFKEIASLTKSGKISPAYMEAFNSASAGDDRLLNWLMRSVHLEDTDVKALRDQGVLMMGDAVFAEPIVGSVPGGANHVIGQATQLADTLAVEWKSEKKISEMDLAKYLEPKPDSREAAVAAHLEKIHQLEPAKAVL